MSAQEKQTRENRRRNLDYALRTRLVTTVQLARELDCDLSYISQLRHGHRPITSPVARRLEQIIGVSPMSLDDTPGVTASVSSITDKELESAIQATLRDEFRRAGRSARGELFAAALKLCMVDARERGYSESRVRFIAKELLR